MTKHTNTINKDSDMPEEPPAARRAKIWALVLATVGGALVYRDYLTGKISGRNDSPAATTLSDELPRHADQKPDDAPMNKEESDDTWRKKTAGAEDKRSQPAPGMLER